MDRHRTVSLRSPLPKALPKMQPQQDKPHAPPPSDAATSGSSKDERTIPYVSCGPQGLIMRDIVTDKVTNGMRDLVLEVYKPGANVPHYYLVSSGVLRTASSYFRVLLDPNKFNEGASFDTAMRALLEKHSSLQSIPPEDLPRIKLTDFGLLPKKPKLEEAMTLYLSILHKTDRFCNIPNLHPLAVMAIMADRFDTVAAIASYVISIPWRENLLNSSVFGDWGIGQEVATRQILLIAMLLKVEPKKFKGHTANLIIKGSDNWKAETEINGDRSALWWNLPGNLEGRDRTLQWYSSAFANSFAEELMSRREHVLDTIGSIQNYFIKLFAFQPNQCRLGYDTSPACNSFQFGEMVRFFARKGTLSLQNSIFPTEQPVAWEGDIETLVSMLREIPSYQIDSNHMHCGARNRLLIALNTVQSFPQIGVCWSCWQTNRHQESWVEGPSGGKWAINQWKPTRAMEPQGCAFHRKTKAMYTAEKREWTATEAPR